MKLLVEKRYEDAVDGGKVGFLDERSTFIGLEIDMWCGTKTVMLLFELVNMAFEDVVAEISNMCAAV